MSVDNTFLKPNSNQTVTIEQYVLGICRNKALFKLQVMRKLWLVACT